MPSGDAADRYSLSRYLPVLLTGSKPLMD